MSGKRLAIVTPVYNRAAELLALFESLSHQDRQEFKWYVVDDGSTDGSWEVIERMKEMAAFPVDVFRKENGGKHTAVNLAMRHVTEPLTFIVDSDDVLPSNSVDIILNSFDEISDSAGLCGISFLKRSCAAAIWMCALTDVLLATRLKFSTRSASRSFHFQNLTVKGSITRTVFGFAFPPNTRCCTRIR